MQSYENIENLFNTEHLSVSLRWLELISVETGWDLRHDEKLKLLGNISDFELDSLHNLNENDLLSELAQSVLERLVLLILVAKNLDALVGSEHSCKVFKNKNSNRIFNNESIKNYLLRSESVEQFYTVVRYLENATC